MRWFNLSAGAWKALVCVLALALATLLATEVWYAPRTLAAGSRGTLGIQYHELKQWGRSRFVIDDMAPDSPLKAAGAQPGDLWYPDRSYDAYRNLEAHEDIGLTLVHDGEPRHVVVQAALQPDSPGHVSALVSGWCVSFLACGLGLLVAFRQPNGLAFRALALFLVTLTLARTTPTYLFLPAGSVFLIQNWLWAAVYASCGATCLLFFFNYPHDQPRDTATKRWLMRYAVPAYAFASVMLVAGSAIRASGYHAPYFHVAMTAVGLAFSLIVLPVTWSNWRNSAGELRQRHFWMFVAFGLILLAPALTGPAALFGARSNYLLVIVRIAFLTSLVLFAYAALRHRVVNTGFVLNRAVVYGAASIGMLVTFALLEWLAHGLFAVSDHEKNTFVDAAIALAIILTFHRLRHSGERWVEQIFFHGWHVKEAALRKFVGEAPYITQPEALMQAFATALDRFTSGAGRAIYRRAQAGDYKILLTSLGATPGRVNVDDPLAVSMRASQSVVHCADTGTSLPGYIALPSLHHGVLDGFVLLESKPGGETYRPDEIEALGSATHQVGLDLRALRMEQLGSQVQELERENERLGRDKERLETEKGQLLAALVGRS
jgi:hypothetical protein